MKKSLTGLKDFFVAYVFLLILFSTLLILASKVSTSLVRGHIKNSLPTLYSEGLYPKEFNFKLFQQDNYTDTIMLYEAASVDSDAAVHSVFTNAIYKSNDYMSLINDLDNFLQGNRNGLTEFQYARYWHGYLIVLRPLLLLFDYSQIRIVNYICFFGLLALLLHRMTTLLGINFSALFLISQLIGAVFFVPISLQFSWTFYIAYAASFFILSKRTMFDCKKLMIVMFIIGGLTSFIDLLVTPVITLGFPLICYLYKNDNSKRKVLEAISASFCWGAGYALVWGSKWVLVDLVTGSSIIKEAIAQMGTRVSGTWNGMELTLSNIAYFCYKTLDNHGLFYPCLIAAIISIIVFIISIRSKSAFIESCYLLLIASMAPVWFIVLREHSIQHGWFTWRALTVSVFAILLFIYDCCDFNTIIKRVANPMSALQRR